MISPTTITELERLAKEATAGPWRACGCGKCSLVWSLPLDDVIGSSTGRPGDDVGSSRSVEEQSNNAQLIAALRNSLPELLAAAKFGVRARTFLREQGDAIVSDARSELTGIDALLAEVRDG